MQQPTNATEITSQQKQPQVQVQNQQTGDSNHPSYQCKYCKKTFARAEHLSRHERSHTSERPFACPQCKRAFLRKDVLARHKRLVHTKPEDREPPKKRGRPPKSSYPKVDEPVRKESIGTAPSNPQTTTQPTTTGVDTTWPDQNTTGPPGQTPFQFPKLDGEPQNGSFLTNPFNDNFGFGPLDTLSEFNFAEEDILSFLNPTQNRNIRDTPLYDTTNTSTTTTTQTNGAKPVVLQPDFVDWLQMNRDDYSFSMHHSPRLEGPPAPPAKDLIEPNDQKEILVNPANPSTSVLIDEQTYADIVNSLQTKYKKNVAADFVLPTRRALERFISLFFDCFHPHFPIMHVPTFNPGTIQIPLLLSICCIGAMYCMERDKARALWEQSRRIVDVMIAEECLTPGEYPLWVGQILFIHCWYAAWLGDNKLLEWALGRRGSLATYVIRKQIALSRHGPSYHPENTWINWIANESEKRICIAIFVLLSLLTLTFEAGSLIAPADVTLLLPHDDTLWSASTDESWRSLLPQEDPPMYCMVMRAILSGTLTTNLQRRYVFGGMALLYGLHTELRQYSRCAQSFYAFNGSQPPSEISTQMHMALNICRNFLGSGLPEHKQSLTNSERRMLFTCNTLLRLGSFRVYTQLGMPHVGFGPSILTAFATYDVDIIDRAIQNFNSTYLSRCPERTAAARLAVERWQLPLGLGYALQCKTAALNWSLDHVSCSIEPTLYLSKWLETVEEEKQSGVLDDEEREILTRLQDLMSQTELNIQDVSLSAVVLELGAGLLTETWVYGFPLHVGAAYQRQAKRYRERVM